MSVCLCVFGEGVVCTHVCQCVRVYACVVLCVVYVSVRWGMCVRIHVCVRARVYVSVFSVCVCVCVCVCVRVRWRVKRRFYEPSVEIWFDPADMA